MAKSHSRPKPRPQYAPAAQRLMLAHNEYFTAGAVWNRREGIWTCILAAPILSWMRKLDPASAKVELARRGCSWKWIPMDTKNFSIFGSSTNRALPNKSEVPLKSGNVVKGPEPVSGRRWPR